MTTHNPKFAETRPGRQRPEYQNRRLHESLAWNSCLASVALTHHNQALIHFELDHNTQSQIHQCYLSATKTETRTHPGHIFHDITALFNVGHETWLRVPRYQLLVAL
jgi:hypothetical protein